MQAVSRRDEKQIFGENSEGAAPDSGKREACKVEQMQFGYIGINYKDAKLEIRDKVSFTDNQKIDFLQKAEKVGIDQCMILSTCNRSELFFFYREEKQFEEMRSLYIARFPEIKNNCYLNTSSGAEAMEYLFRIAAGLESLVLGEDQILGQVKDAQEFSRMLGYGGKELNRVVRDAVTCAKKIKSRLKISENPLSVSSIGIRQVDQICGIKGKQVLVIGSGSMAVLAIRYLYEYEAGKVAVCSRTPAHAKELLTDFPELSTVSYEQRYQEIEKSDIVISATSSPHLVVRRESIRLTHKTVFLDLALPRDIDEELRKAPLAHLLDLDALEQIASENQAQRIELTKVSSRWIKEAVKETQQWLSGSRVDATIESLQQKCDLIVEDSFSYLNRKMDLEAREQKLLRKILKASLHRLIREPILELKQLESKEQQEEYQKVVEELFHI